MFLDNTSSKQQSKRPQKYSKKYTLNHATTLFQVTTIEEDLASIGENQKQLEVTEGKQIYLWKDSLFILHATQIGYKDIFVKRHVCDMTCYSGDGGEGKEERGEVPGTHQTAHYKV